MVDIITRLENVFMNDGVVIKTDASGNHLEWDNNRIDLPMFCPKELARSYVINNNRKLSADIIKKNINLKYSITIEENKKWKELVDNGVYIGEMDEVRMVTHNTSNSSLNILKIFVPYFGNINVTSVDITKYSIENYSKRIFELFQKTGVIYSIPLSHVRYVPKKNHLFVKRITLEEFCTLEKEYADYSIRDSDSITNNEIEFLESKITNLEEELSNKECELANTKMDNHLYKEKCEEYEYLLVGYEELADLELDIIEQEKIQDSPYYGYDFSYRDGEGSWRMIIAHESGKPIFGEEGFPLSGEEGLLVLEKGLIKKNPVESIISDLKLDGRCGNIKNSIELFLQLGGAGKLNPGIKFCSNCNGVELPNLVERADAILIEIERRLVLANASL